MIRVGLVVGVRVGVTRLGVGVGWGVWVWVWVWIWVGKVVGVEV